MARLNQVKERLHMPLYDAFHVAAGQQMAPAMVVQQSDRVLRFFIDLNNKTRLDTNLQAAGQLPSQNAFEIRALRVTASHVGFVQDPAPPGGVVPAPRAFLPGEFLSLLLHNSVTTLLVGEKVAIEAPTWNFPSGAGVTSPLFASHGQPSPMDTFRFSEPVVVEPHQNFRVEIQFPTGLPPDLQHALGDFRIWAMLDGYMTRDVQ